MYKIYCLINSLTKRPFYVGVTQRELKTRLSMHISKSYFNIKSDGFTKDRTIYIKNVIDNKGVIMISLLDTAEKDDVDFKEKYYYYYLKNKGCVLLQCKNSFTYTATVRGMIRKGRKPSE